MYGDRLIEITWCPRSAPQAPISAAAHGAVATRQAQRLLQEPVDGLSQLKAVGGPGQLQISQISGSPGFPQILDTYDRLA